MKQLLYILKELIDMNTDNNLLEIGKIVNTHGLRGEVKVVVWMDYPEDFEEIKTVYLKTRKELKQLTVKNVKYQKNNLIVKFSEFNDINEVEQYKNCTLYADRDELGELPEGTHYIVDLIGLDVVDEDGAKIGVIADVFNTGASDIYDVKREGKKNLLLPVIDDVVKEIDIEGGKITVHILEGLDDEV
jgi:16S rRNA processing protein RimM